MGRLWNPRRCLVQRYVYIMLHPCNRLPVDESLQFASQYTTMSAELKAHMRQNKRRTLPNSKEMVVNYNRRTSPETISEHNDPLRIEWTEIPANPKAAPEYVTGDAALRIPDFS